MKVIKIGQLVYFILILSQFSNGQLSIEEPLKIAIEKAIEKDLSLQNQALDIEKLKIDRQKLLNKYIPKLEATSALALYDNSFTLDVSTTTLPISGIQLFEGKTQLESTGNLFRSELTLSSVLFSGNQIQNGAEALAKKAEGSSYLLDSDKDKIAKAVIQSFDQLFLIQSSEELLLDTQTRLQKESERIEKAIKNGVAVPYDRDKIKLAQLELTQNGCHL